LIQSISTDVVTISVPADAVAFRCVDGDPLPVLSGWLKKRSRRTRSWDKRFFYVDPDEKRLYYIQNGPVESDMDHSVGLYHSLAKVISSTFHKLVDGDDSTESWLDLRLIPDVEFGYRNKKSEKNCFEIDLG
jgi:hypothetical protein